MTLTHAGIAVLLALAVTGSVAAKGTGSDKVHCPVLASEARMAALEGQLGSLEGRLEALDARLTALDDVRSAALERAKERVESAVHNPGRSQEQVDADVAGALREAQAEGEATARSALAARQAMETVRSQMETLRQQMRSLAAHQTSGKDADAG
jgi:chromosome segregation ATPase